MLAHAQTSHLLLHLGHLWGGGEIIQPWYSLDTCTQTTCTHAPTHATHTHTLPPPPYPPHTHTLPPPPYPPTHPNSNSNPPGSAFESSTLVAELAVLPSAAGDKGNHGDTQRWAGLHCGRGLNCTTTRWLPCPMAAKLPAEVCPYQREAVVCPYQREAEVCPLQRGGGGGGGRGAVQWAYVYKDTMAATTTFVSGLPFSAYGWCQPMGFAVCCVLHVP